MELRGTVGLLTGASRGIGVYLARALAHKGVRLALVARSYEDLTTTAKEIEDLGGEALPIAADVSRREDLERVVATAREQLGPVDVLVNNAGIERYTHYQDAKLEDIEAILRTNVLAAEWLTRLVLPDMLERRKGHIVNIASVAGKTAVPYNAVYSSSKHALVGFSWSLREELRPQGIGVSVICPGFVSDAGMFHDWSKGKRAPSLVSTVSPQQVAAKTIGAIEGNKAEVIVSSPIMKVVDVINAISPDLAGWIGRRTRSYEYLEKQAVPAWKNED